LFSFFGTTFLFGILSNYMCR